MGVVNRSCSASATPPMDTRRDSTSAAAAVTRRQRLRVKHSTQHGSTCRRRDEANRRACSINSGAAYW
jgi:hypothetical protein